MKRVFLPNSKRIFFQQPHHHSLTHTHKTTQRKYEKTLQMYDVMTPIIKARSSSEDEDEEISGNRKGKIRN